MKINVFQKHVFWSYSENADLPEETIARQVILYGEISDMIMLTKKVKKEVIEKVLNSMTNGTRNKKRINFFQKVILD